MKAILKPIIIAGVMITTAVGFTFNADAEFSKTSGVYRAKAGVECITREDGVAAATLHDLELTELVVAAKDTVAWSKLLDTKTIVMTKPNVTVFVVDRVKHSIKIRQQGQLGYLWMMAYDLECPMTVARKVK